MLNELSADAFVESYAKAFKARDERAVTDFCNIPCLSIRADRSLHTFSHQTEIEGFVMTVLEAHS